jgi:type-F conjugative transfer system pilin assembly protein TrbC
MEKKELLYLVKAFSRADFQPFFFFFYSKSYQKLTSKTMRKILFFVFSLLLAAGIANNVFAAQENKKEQILIFVSFSMPEPSLKQWLIEAHQAGAHVVIRGLKNNSFKETASIMTKLLKDTNAGGIELNPVAFQKYKITKVPAVVVVNNESQNYDVVYGNVTLEYALKEIRKRNKA